MDLYQKYIKRHHNKNQIIVNGWIQPRYIVTERQKYGNAEEETGQTDG